MPTYPTPEPVEATVKFAAGHLTVTATDDASATATVEALDPTDQRAVTLAQSAKVSLDARRLSVELPTTRGTRRSPVHVRLHLPARSDVVSHSADLVLTTDGELGDVRVRTGSGQVHVAVALGCVDVKAGDADVVVGTATAVSVTCGRGTLRVGSAGDVTLKTGHGQAELQQTSGRVVVRGGGVALDLRETSSGDVRFETGAGSACVGVLAGTTVQLDLSSAMGAVRCDLPMEQASPTGGAALRLRLRTGSGDVVVHRAGAA